MVTLSTEEIRRQVRGALAEDIGAGDVTSMATVPRRRKASAMMVAREPLVLAGLSLAEAAFKEVSSQTAIRRLAQDGERVGKGAALLQVQGPARALLAAERVALNFVQRLSGIATLTARYVEKVRGTRAVILDTRKTTPHWRALKPARVPPKVLP